MAKLPKKIPDFNSMMLPAPYSIPQSIAASIGRTLTRHSYLQFLQLRCIYLLLEISIKQARQVVKIPRASGFVGLVETLLAYHRIKTDFPFNKLHRIIDRADTARNILAHSVLSKDGKKIRIQIVRGTWDLPQQYESVPRVLIPETPIVDRAFLTKQRKAVEDAVKEVLILVRNIHGVMHTLNEKRPIENGWDRRRPPRNGVTP